MSLLTITILSAIVWVVCCLILVIGMCRTASKSERMNTSLAELFGGNK